MLERPVHQGPQGQRVSLDLVVRLGALEIQVLVDHKACRVRLARQVLRDLKEIRECPVSPGILAIQGILEPPERQDLREQQGSLVSPEHKDHRVPQVLWVLRGQLEIAVLLVLRGL